jgi:GT2 family glycosyltransferase
MEVRLDRVENSLLFRALRRAAAKLNLRAPVDSGHDYSDWLEQCGWMAPSLREQAAQMEGWRKKLCLTYIAGSQQAAESARMQGPPPCQLLEYGDADSWRSALKQAQGEFCVVMGGSVVLSTLAAYRWGELLQDDPGSDAIYSDWDHIAASGQRQAPRFTPQLSQELLANAPYWGDCLLLRTSVLKDVGDDLNPADPAGMHALSRRIVESGKKAARIPQTLWHSTLAPTSVEQPDSATGGAAAQASLVICTRTPKLLERCLSALRRTDAAQAEIVVVAHNQGTGTNLNHIATSHGARAVSYSGQFHFGVMNALGARHASRPALVFLNDDVGPISSAWVSRLLRPLQDHHVGITGGLLLYPDNTIQHAGISVGGRPYPSHLGRRQTSSPWWPWLRITREVSAVTGACLAIRRAVWDELGGFDPRFQVNYNDVDLCLRARRAGYSVILECGAVLHHREAQTRSTIVTPEEKALFTSVWASELARPDPFFNPNLTLRDERIALAHPCFAR